MKKLLTLVLTALLISACSAANSYSYLSNGDEVIFTGPDKLSYSRNDLYKSLKVSGEEQIVFDMLKNVAMKTADVDMEAIGKEADDLISSYVESGLETYIVSQYGSLENYRLSYVNSMIMQKLATLYVQENYDTLIAEKKPVKMQLASFSELESAEKCLEDVGNGSTFDMAAANNGSVNTPQSNIYTDDDTSLDIEVKDYLNSTDALGLSSIITHTVATTDADGNAVETNTYYVLNVESRNPDDFKDELIEQLAYDVEGTTLTDYFFSKHHFAFYDQDIYELLSADYEVFK